MCGFVGVALIFHINLGLAIVEHYYNAPPLASLSSPSPQPSLLVNMPSAGPLYNVPMALDDSLSGTHGLEPRLAMARLRRHVSNANKHTIGPMPVELFMKEFLPPHPGDASGRLSSRNAFTRVPQCADVPARICKPLVRCLRTSTGIAPAGITRSIRPAR